jgi:hypothetical protein
MNPAFLSSFSFSEQEIEKLKEERKAGALQYFAGKFLLSPINISTILLQE